MVAQTVPAWQFDLMRKFPRIGFVTPVEALVEGAVINAQSRNLSVGGMLLDANCNLPPGARLHVHFQLSTGDAVVAAARVVHCRPGVRMGIEFTNLASATREAVAHATQIEPCFERRSIRIPERLFVSLQWNQDGTTMEQPAQTVLLSLHGCLLLSETAPQPNAPLLICWREGEIRAAARVVSRQQDPDGLFKVALEFVDDTNFWGIDFESGARKQCESPTS
jgi:hypothetical protein